MIVINDEKKLLEYCERYDISSHFTEWNALKKKLVRYKKGELIVMYGSITDKLFFLVSGAIRFSCIADNYEEYFFFNAKNEGIFGEVEYVMNIPSITQSEVIEECECILIPLKENRDLLDNDIKFQKFLTRILAKKYNDIRSKYMDIESYPLEIRLIRYLLTDKNNNVENLGQIAKSINCSYRQLLRILKKFCDNSWMEHLEQKGKYRIVNREAMEQKVNEF